MRYAKITFASIIVSCALVSAAAASGCAREPSQAAKGLTAGYHYYAPEDAARCRPAVKRNKHKLRRTKVKSSSRNPRAFTDDRGAPVEPVLTRSLQEAPRDTFAQRWSGVTLLSYEQPMTVTWPWPPAHAKRNVPLDTAHNAVAHAYARIVVVIGFLVMLFALLWPLVRLAHKQVKIIRSL
jgi:hypothetical protein